MRKLTKKQKEIVSVIIKQNADGSCCDIDQILLKLSYKTTKESLQFSLRHLIARELIIKVGRDTRRERSRIVYSSTKKLTEVLNDSYDD